MNKKYKKRPENTWIIIPAYSLIPLVRLFFDRSIDMVLLIQLAMYLIVSIIIFKYHNRIIAEIKNDVLIFYSGIGLNDPSQIDIKSITKTERKSNNLLAISYENKIMSLEADKSILNQLEKDIMFK